MCVCYLNVNFDVFNRKIKILLSKIYGKFSFDSILILNIKILFNILNRIFKCFFFCKLYGFWFGYVFILNIIYIVKIFFQNLKKKLWTILF